MHLHESIAEEYLDAYGRLLAPAPGPVGRFVDRLAVPFASTISKDDQFADENGIVRGLVR